MKKKLIARWIDGRYSHVVLVSPILIWFLLRPDIFELETILRKCTEWPQNDIEHHKVKASKVYHTYSSIVTAESQISVSSALQFAIPEYLQIFIFPLTTQR